MGVSLLLQKRLGLQAAKAHAALLESSSRRDMRGVC